MELKQRVLNLIEEGYGEEQKLIASLSDEERVAVGQADDWAIKDVFVHLTFWKDVRLQDMAAAARGETPPERDDFQTINERVFEENRDRPWEWVLEERDRVHRATVEAVESLSNEQLIDTSPEWQNGRPLWRSIIGNGYLHPLTHLADIYTGRGDRDYAMQLLERSAERSLTLSDEPAWAGVVQYNLACAYALNSRHDEAIEKLRQALVLNPDLIEWSKEDSDLDSIRELPECQAIYRTD